MPAIQEVIASDLPAIALAQARRAGAKQSLTPWNFTEIVEPVPSKARNLFYLEVLLWPLAFMNN